MLRIAPAVVLRSTMTRVSAVRAKGMGAVEARWAGLV
jgi:hypothetical protein